MIDNSHGWSGANTVSSVTRAPHRSRPRSRVFSCRLDLAHKARMRQFVLQVDLEQ